MAKAKVSGAQAVNTFIDIFIKLLFTLQIIIMQRYTAPKISNAANLSVGCWNCGGFSKVKKELVSKLNFDICCLTELHGWRDDDRLMVYSDMPSKQDPWSGVALMINPRLAKYIMNSDFIGSRISYCRFRGLSFNIFVVGVYIPQKQRKNPDQKATYDELESLLMRVSQRDCIILLGDFNSRLSRDIYGRVGHWCIHNHRDAGGDRLLSIMNSVNLRCVSTYYQPRKKHSNATFVNVQPDKPPSQIDYILVSSRWSSSVRSCSTKWGLAIDAYGRKYDHALVRMDFRPRLKCDRRSLRKDFASLRIEDIAVQHNRVVEEELSKSNRPADLNGQWERLQSAMKTAQDSLPNTKRLNGRKWETSKETLDLVKLRSQTWQNLNADDQKNINRAISRSARKDYRDYVERLLVDIEKYDREGNTREVFRIAKSLSSRANGSQFTQPNLDLMGNIITTSEQQLDAWATFLEQKFSPLPNEDEVDLINGGNDQPVEDITLEEVKASVKKLNSGKACGPDALQIEQFKASELATTELHQLLLGIWTEEVMPKDFVLADMLMHYKKKCKNNRSNYRALGLLNHCYKALATVLLMRILPFISPKISDMQAGFRKSRGCRDNILILVMTIQHLLENALPGESKGVITYIDFTAAFDSISHSFLLNALKEYNVPLKYCRLIKAIYDSAAVRVRLQERGGSKCYSRNVSIKRGVIQGDIPSAVCFLVSLDKILKDHGSLDMGLKVTEELLLSDMEFADDASLPNEDTNMATVRLTTLNEKAEEKAGMQISIPKTKNQHIMKRPIIAPTTEADIDNLPPEKALKFICDKCGYSFANHHGLRVHQGRHCKKRKTNKKQVRRGTVADRVVTEMKVREHQNTLPKVRIGNDEIDNVYSFPYLGAEVAGDGDPEIMVQHRENIAWGRFNEYRRTLTTTKLPKSSRTRLHRTLIVSTLIYGSSAWLFTDQMKRKVNGINSRMLSAITRRSIHDEARSPSLDAVQQVMDRRWEYLGHILRLDDHRALKKYLLALCPNQQPFPEGWLPADSNFRNMDEMVRAAANRKQWRANKWRRPEVEDEDEESLTPSEDEASR